MEISQKAEEIFLSALEITNKDERLSFLYKQCFNNSKLKESVEELISDYERANNVFQESSKKLKKLKREIKTDNLTISSMIGPYHIIGVLGEGGCGIVYKAERREPLKLKVALKVLKSGMDTQTIMSRFETEKQTLALMEHPNIAHVIDAGETENRRPFFVMELVQGEKITDYCKKNNLSINERLKLILSVCSAIQHAHNKGVIHRDIKPSNILITKLDGIAVPKVIDFGIAKATNLNAYQGETIQGQWIGTPGYMSPEQFADKNRDIDTRSDVYSLGMILYELITGYSPFDNNQLINEGFQKVKDRILNETPIAPDKICHNKKRKIPSDLSLLILKAINKNRNQRYETINELATDITNFLEKKPVKAHPAKGCYILRKLIIRNKLASLTSFIALLVVFFGFSASTLLYIRAHNAEHKEYLLRQETEEREHITKAAIYIMQRKMVEADQEIRNIDGLPTQTSLEATNVFRALATWSAMNGDWKTSADRWLAMSKVNHFDENDMSYSVTEDLLPISPLLITIKDYERYHAFQNFVIQRLEKTTNPIAAEHVLKMCLITPTSKSILERLKPTLEVAKKYTGKLEEPPIDTMESWRCIAVALWYYRDKQPQTAINYCNKTLNIYHRDETQPAMAKLIRAMSYIRLGNRQKANKDLIEANTIIDEHFMKPLDERTGGYWHDWLNVRIMQSEAEKLTIND
jgi:hypothetical protein